MHAKVKVESDQETISADLTLHQLEILDTSEEDQINKIAFWHKQEDQLDQLQLQDSIYNLSPEEHESQLTCKAKILLSMEPDKYKPDELADVIDADVMVVLHHSILSVNLLLIDQLIHNANHAF